MIHDASFVGIDEDEGIAAKRRQMFAEARDFTAALDVTGWDCRRNGT
ncbi:MAG TPA: hypothetical protein VGN93_08030 [Shinella sp.]|jgi:hypothetical protein|nr:hypothetical protein [Shinella sp.]